MKNKALKTKEEEEIEEVETTTPKKSPPSKSEKRDRSLEEYNLNLGEIKKDDKLMMAKLHDETLREIRTKVWKEKKIQSSSLAPSSEESSQMPSVPLRVTTDAPQE